MGTQISVSAQTVNLNGNEHIKDKEPVFIKGYIDSTNQDRRNTFGDYIQQWGMKSNAIKARSYHIWAETHLGDKIGIMQSTFFISRKKDSEVLRSYLKTYFGIVPPKSLTLEKWSASVFDSLNYAEYFVIENRPDKVDDPYTVTENRVAIYRTETDPEGGYYQVFDHFEYSSTITYSDGSTDVLSTTPLRSNTTQQYLYARCTTQNPVDPTKKITLVLWYPQYSGDETLDTFFSEPTANFYTYLTPIPIRIDNKFPDDDPNLKDYLFPTIKKAWRMCHTTMNSKSDYKAVKKMLEDSESLPDIDYAYIVHGVNIAGESASEKAYIYSFFYDIHAQDYYARGLVPGTTGMSYSDWKNTEAANAVKGEKHGIDFINPDDGSTYHIKYVPNTQSISAKGNYGIDINIDWSTTGYFLMTGLAEPKARRGRYYTSYEVAETSWEEEEGGESGGTITVHYRYYIMQCKFQIRTNQYVMVAIANPIHQLVIYRGRGVSTDIYEGFHPKDGADFSNFILPINVESFKHTPLLKEDAVAENMYYMVCESYVVKHTSWFQDFFGIILIVVGVVLWKFGGGFIAKMGMALIAAGVLSIAMLVIEPLLVALFGEKIGGILASIFRVVGAIVITFFTFGAGAPATFASLMTFAVANVLLVSIVVGLATFVQGFMSGKSFGEALFGGIIAGIGTYFSLGGFNAYLPEAFQVNTGSMIDMAADLDAWLANPETSFSSEFSKLFSGDTLSKMAGSMIKNPSTWLHLADIAFSAVQKIQLDKLETDFKKFLNEYKEQMNVIKNIWEENFGLYSVNTIAVLQLISALANDSVNGNNPGETDTAANFLYRTLMCGSDVVDTVTGAIGDMCDNTLTLTLPRLDN